MPFIEPRLHRIFGSKLDDDARDSFRSRAGYMPRWVNVSSALVSFTVLMACVADIRGGEHPTDKAVIEKLVTQLEDSSFRQREEACQRLRRIGEPALPALRQAADSQDPEMRWRSLHIIQQIAFDAQLAKWQGAWETGNGETMTIAGDHWATSHPVYGSYAGKLKVVEIGPHFAAVDMHVEQGRTKGKTCRAIFHLDDKTLHYCGTYNVRRPTKFNAGGGDVYYAWQPSNQRNVDRDSTIK